MNYEQIIRHYVTQAAAARAAGVGQPSVANWKARGIVPFAAQVRLERHSDGKLKADWGKRSTSQK